MDGIFGGYFRHGLMASAAIVCMAGAQPAIAQTRTFNVTEQDAASGVAAFARQADIQLLISARDARGRRTNAVRGDYTVADGLQRLLANSGLRAQATGAQTYSVVPMSGEAQAGGAAADSESAGEQEIVVTARKREERLQDVPVPVSVLQADALLASNQRRLQDYYASVPGLNLGVDNRGAPSMSIRGITTGAYVTPTVGFTVDEVPFGSSVVVSSFSPAPDVDPNELSAVEILRGPQGTLYGASSIGGLIKYNMIEPSTDGIRGRLQAGLSSVRNGDGIGFNIGGAVNLPLGESVAVRASAFARQEAGYIDNARTGEDGVNERRAEGGRLSLLWRPSSQFSIRLGAFIQRSRADGSSQINDLPGLGALQHDYLGGTGGYEREVQAFTAHVRAGIGSAELTSITGYSIGRSDDTYDVSSGLGFLTNLLFGVGTVIFTDADNETTNFSQEVRLSLPIGERLNWRVGGFFTDQRTEGDGGFILIDPVTFAPGQQVLRQLFAATYEEYAIFSDLTLRISERFDVQFGGRWSHNDQTYDSTQTGPLVPVFYQQTSPFVAPRVESSDSSFTYLVAPRFRITPDLMVYARLASGYRPGGPNSRGPNIPETFDPDRTQNFEFGIKGDLVRNLLSVDASIYHITWRDIQIGLFDPTTFGSYTGNATRARSQGIEASLTARPTTGMALTLWGVWNDSALSEPLPANSSVQAAAGDRLPYSTRFSAGASLEQQFPIGRATGNVGASLNHVGRRQGEFTAAPPRQVLPSYTRIDLHAGVRHGQWTANLFVNNLTDSRGRLGGGLGTFPAFAFELIQPRTIGINVGVNF